MKVEGSWISYFSSKAQKEGVYENIYFKLKPYNPLCRSLKNLIFISSFSKTLYFFRINLSLPFEDFKLGIRKLKEFLDES